jgi:SAM-dependent methyltransferase
MKKFITEAIQKFNGKEFRIMNLASGPCREIKELKILDETKKKIQFDCFDQDGAAIKYAKKILGSKTRFVNFRSENAIRLALKKDIRVIIPKKYNFIYSMGLFDYLDARIAVRLVRNLRGLLKPHGCMIIANMREKFQNSSVYFLEWVGDWNLIYRGEDEYRKIFVDAGFSEKKVKILSEQLGIIQYAAASA